MRTTSSRLLTLPPLSIDRGIWVGVPVVIITSVTALMSAFVGYESLLHWMTIAVILSTMFTVTFALIASRMRPALRQLVERQRFVRWQYNGALWDRYVTAGKRRLIRLAPFAVLFIIGCVVVVLVALWVEADYRTSRWLAALVAEPFLELLYSGLAFFGILLASALFVDVVVAVRAPMLSRDGGLAYIGRDAVYFCGSVGWLEECRSATWVDSNPPTLRLVFAKGKERCARRARESARNLCIEADLKRRVSQRAWHQHARL